LCRVKNMLAMYLKYHKAGLATPVTSIAISSVKMSIGRKSLSNLRSEMIFPVLVSSNPRTTERRKYVARDLLSLCCHLAVHCQQNLRIICQYGGVDGRKI
jgi:hypothetical protein